MSGLPTYCACSQWSFSVAGGRDRKLNYFGVCRLQRSGVRSCLGSPIFAHDGRCGVVFGDAPYSTKQWLRPQNLFKSPVFSAGGPGRAGTNIMCKPVHGVNDSKVDVKAWPLVDRHS